MQTTRRQFLGTAIGAATLTATIGTAAFSEDLTKIRMGYIADYFGTSMVAIATEKGMWAKHGLEADTKVFTNGPIQVQALNAGSLDYAYIGPGAVWLPAGGQTKIIAVNDLGFTDRVIAQPGIKDMQGLRGKKVGVPEGTSGDMLLRLALDKAGMTLADIEVVKMDPSTIVTAFASKQIDGAGIWYPFVQVIRNRIPDVVELSSNAEFYPKTAFPSCFLVSDENSKDEATILKVIAVIKEAVAFRQGNMEEAVKITAKFLGVPEEPLMAEAKAGGKSPTIPELEAMSADGTVDHWFDTLAKLYVEFGKVKDPLPASQFYLSKLYAQK